MLDLLILLSFNSLLCLGFWNACLYIKKEDIYTGVEEIKGVLWRLEKFGGDNWWYKPIGGCLPCMASLHSIYPYWTFMYATNALNINALLFYPVYILALSGLNYLIDRE